MDQPVLLDPDGTILSPCLQNVTLCGLVHHPDDRLVLHLFGDEGEFQMTLPGVKRVFTMTDPELGSVYATRSVLFEARYAPVTEETVFSVREGYEDRRAWSEDISKEIRATQYALEWWTSYGTDGVALSDAEPVSLTFRLAP